MFTFKRIRLSTLLALCIVGSTFMIACFLTYLWFTHEYRQFNAGARVIHGIFVDNTKQRLQERVKTALKEIDFVREKAQTLLHAQLEHASRIAAGLLANPAAGGLSPVQTANLSNVFNEYGHVIPFAGEMVVFVHDLSKPVRWLLFFSAPDSDGSHVHLKPEILPDKLFENKATAFAHYRAPGGHREGLFVHVRLLPDQNLVVGAGVNMAAWTRQLQLDVLAHLARMRFGREGYLFGSTLTGDSLFSNGEITRGTGNILGLTDPDGVKIIQEQQKAAQGPDGGFVAYRWRKFTDQEPASKLSYVKAEPEWGWVIGSGQYLDEMETAIARHRRELEYYLWSNFLKIMIPIICGVVVVFVAMLWVTRRFRLDFERFEKDFAKFVFEKKPMEPKAFWLLDLVRLAQKANRLALKHRRTEKALKASQNEYREMIQFAPAGIFEVDLSTSRMNKTALLLNPWIGYSRQELLDMNIRELIAEESRQDYENFIALLMGGENISNTLELVIQNKSGEKRWCLFGISRASSPKSGNVFRMVYLDIHQRKTAETALADSEVKFRTLFDLSPQPITLSDMDARIVDLNLKACQLVNRLRSEMLGKTPVEMGFMDTEDMRQFSALLKEKGEVSGFKKKALGADGSIHSLLLYAQPVRIHSQPFVLTIFLDVTDQEKLEAHFSQIQKLEAVGTLAGGVAHDMNNLLMVIQGNVSLMKNELSETHRLFERLEKIESTVKSGSDLTRRLLGFARGGKYEVKQTDLNRFLSQQNKVFGRTRKEVQIHEDFMDSLWPVAVDQSQMEQVILNLYINAWQAMPEGGELFVATANKEMDEVSAGKRGIKPGHYVRVSVADTGKGMDDAVRARIFEPFFTTKERGTGTGLGLASVYGIIKNHGGAIFVESAPDKGACFDILLPACLQSGWPVPVPATAETRQGTETILLVDDESLVLSVGKEMLEALGYTVFCAATLQEAEERVRAAHPGEIHLAVLDIIMPNSGGKKVLQVIKDALPDLPVLLCSGYSAANKASEWMVQNSNGFIQKPFNLSELSRKVRTILDKAPARRPD